MAEPTPPLMRLRTVRAIAPCAEGVRLSFADGSEGVLDRRQKEYAYYLELARRSLERVHPVGIGLRGQDVVVVGRAQNDLVESVEEVDRERVRVCFVSHDGVFYLRRDHPEFKRLLEVLKAAREGARRVWFVAGLRELWLLDVALGEK